MKLKTLMLIATLSTTFAWAGEKGHGGDVISCSRSSLNNLDGLYVLDYVLTVKKTDPVDSRSTDEVLKAIEVKLTTTLPELATKFARFRTELLQEDWSNQYVWIGSRLSLIDLKDEELIRQLPENCSPQKIQQAVLRQNGATTTFQYDENVLAELSLTKTEQSSYLFVHEFLRDLTDDVEVIRLANRYLHSKQFMMDDESKVATVISKMGLGYFRTKKYLDYLNTYVGLNLSCEQVGSDAQDSTEADFQKTIGILRTLSPNRAGVNDKSSRDLLDAIYDLAIRTKKLEEMKRLREIIAEAKDYTPTYLIGEFSSSRDLLNQFKTKLNVVDRCLKNKMPK